MVQVDWAQPALEDLQEVYEFIARDSPRYAQLTALSEPPPGAGIFARRSHAQ